MTQVEKKEKKKLAIVLVLLGILRTTTDPIRIEGLGSSESLKLCDPFVEKAVLGIIICGKIGLGKGKLRKGGSQIRHN